MPVGRDLAAFNEALPDLVDERLQAIELREIIHLIEGNPNRGACCRPYHAASAAVSGNYLKTYHIFHQQLFT